MSHQAFFDALHDAQVRLREEAARDAIADREDDEGDELAEWEPWCSICEEGHTACGELW